MTRFFWFWMVSRIRYATIMPSVITKAART
jgi:hypothetical protein